MGRVRVFSSNITENNWKRRVLRGDTVKSGSTIYPRLCSGPRSQIISSFICRLLGFQSRASRGCSPQFFKKGNFDQNYQKIVEKLKCRGPVSTFLAMIDPRYIRSIDGKSSIFSNGTLLFWRTVAKIGQKSDFVEKMPKKVSIFNSDFSKVLTPESRKKLIFNFWFSTCRRKITRGFRIWPYFYEFSTQKWSKTAIYSEIWVYSDALQNVKTRHKWSFLTTFAWKVVKNEVRFGILV